MAMSTGNFETPEEHCEISTKEQDLLERLRKNIGAEEADLIPQTDYLRIIRGYQTETPEIQWEKASNVSSVFLNTFIKAGIPDIKPPTSGERLKKFDILRKAYPICVYGQDKEGHPVIYEKLSELDLAAVQAVDIDDVFEYRNTIALSAVWNKNKQCSEARGVQQYKYVHIIDMSGLGLFGCRNYLSFVQEILARGNLVYCEMVRSIYMVNCGWSFTALWSMVKNFIDPNTIKKIHVLGGSYQNKVLEGIDASQLAPVYGGSNPEPLEFSTAAKFFDQDGGAAEN